ncbi:MAG: PAS domain S-box protein [Azonexus sp.]|nr:PAS domain S-box protein [Azonexus sp.]
MLAGMIALVMLAVRLAMMPVDAGFIYITFYPGIALTIFLCGVGPGVFNIGLATLIAAYVFFPPYWSFGEHPYLLPASAGFVASALTILLIILFFQRQTELQHRRLLNERSERQRAEQDVAETGVRLTEIINSAMDAIISVDADQRIILFNPAAEKTFGYSASEIIGTSIEGLIPGCFRPKHAEHMRHYGTFGATSRKISSLGELYALRRDGSEFPIEAAISQTPGNKNPVFTVVLRDISERRQSEQALITSRKQLTTLIEQAPVCIAMFDRNMNYIATSRRWLTDYGGGQADLSGRNHYEVHPDISEEWKQVHREGLAGKSARRDQDMWVKADGSRNWLRWAVHPWTDEAGIVGGIIISAEDVTRHILVEKALRASEDDLIRAQAVGNTGSWRLDVRRNELTWSAENHRIFGIPEGTPLTYETFLSQVHPDDRYFVDRMWQSALTGKPYAIEHRLLVDGAVKWVIEKAELEFDAAGELIGGFGITQDITGRRLMENQLKEAHDRLTTLAAEQATHLRELSDELTRAEQRERDQLYELLHDHVQPLLVGARLGLCGICKDTRQEETLRIVAEANELISLVLQTARTLSVELNPPLIRERGLIPALESLCRWVQSNHGLIVDMDCAPNTEPANMTIRLLCFKAVRELLMNVVKYANTRHAVLDLEWVPENMLRITVRDHGVGFNPADLHTGSGLANIERRLGMVGGYLSIQSMLGEGTIASIHAPLDLRSEKSGQSWQRMANSFSRRRKAILEEELGEIGEDQTVEESK